MLKKLRIKFVCINMTIISVMLIVILSLVIHFTGQSLEQTSLQKLEEISSAPFYFSGTMHPGDADIPYFILQLDNKGNLVDGHSGYYDLSDRQILASFASSALETEERYGVLSEAHLRFLHISARNGQFLVFTDISNEISTMEHLTRTCIFIGILSFAVFLWISIYLANWAVQPVDQAWKQQKQFIADASHELKTPLTVILTNGELLKSPDYPPEKKAQFADNILVMAHQMRSLVEGLLELSRLDNHVLKTVFEPLNLSELTLNTLCLFEPLYYEAGLECESELAPDLSIKGSSSHINQVLDILFDNALKYADPDSTIQIHLERQKKHALLSVKTAGTPLSPEELKKIFKRFYRAEKSRSRSGSYGLGLSIAESIVKEHGGRIWADSGDGSNCFYIKLPLWD